MDEQEIVARLVSVATGAGLQADPAWIVGFYVALKSRPMLILTGPPDSGKTLLVASLMQVLTGNSPYQCQNLVGHAWWAGRTGNVALFTEGQTRLNTGKIMALIGEARQPKNAKRVFIACLARISPAELTGFFSEVAFQIQHERLMRLPGYHFTEPVPYPPNLLLIGTMDTTRQDWSDDDLYSMATVIGWQGVVGKDGQNHVQPDSAFSEAGEVFLQSCIRDEQAARSKLDTILGDSESSLELLSGVVGILDEHEIPVPPAILGQSIIYLANAWSMDGRGHFAPQHTDNLAVALDVLMVEDVLRPVGESSQESSALAQQLRRVMDGRFPRSARLLDTLSQS